MKIEVNTRSLTEAKNPLQRNQYMNSPHKWRRRSPSKIPSSFTSLRQHQTTIKMMLSKSSQLIRRYHLRNGHHSPLIIQSLSTKAASTPIGSDGRHEIWREGIYDHDNEPK
jgi:hypothetical protein